MRTHLAGWELICFALLTTAACALARVHHPSDAGQRQWPDLEIYDPRAVGITFSPDGRRVVTWQGASGGASVWDMRSGRGVWSCHDTSVGAYPTDGKHVIVVLSSGRIMRVDTESGTIVHECRLADADAGWEFSLAALSQDGKQVLAVDAGRKAAYRWNTESGALLHRLRLKKAHHGVCPQFRPDGSPVLWNDHRGTVNVWCANTGDELMTFPYLYTGREADVCVWDLLWSPDGRLAMTSMSGRVLLWSVEGRTVAGLAGAFRADGVPSAAFSPDSKMVVYSGFKGPVQLVRLPEKLALVNPVHSSVDDIAIAHLERVINPAMRATIERTFDTAEKYVQSLAFSPDGRSVAVCSTDDIPLPSVHAILEVWSVDTGGATGAFREHSNGMRFARFARDGRHLYTLSASTSDAPSYVWSIDTGKPVRPPETFEGTEVRWDASVVWSDVDYVGVSDATNTVTIWDAARCAAVGKLTVHGHSGKVLAVGVSADHTRVVTAGADGSICVWDARSGNLISEFRGPGGVEKAVFATNARVITCYSNNDVRVWDADSGKLLARIRTRSGRHAISLDGALLATQDGRKVTLWALETGKELRRVNLRDDNLHSLSPDGALGLTVADHNTIRLHDMVTGKELRRFEGHSHNCYVLHAQFSPDGSLVISASVDGSARLWDTTTGAEICKLVVRPYGQWLVVAADGRYDSSEDGHIERVYWATDPASVAVEQYRQQYYTPGLLARILATKPAPGP